MTRAHTADDELGPVLVFEDPITTLKWRVQPASGDCELHGSAGSLHIRGSDAASVGDWLRRTFAELDWRIGVDPTETSVPVLDRPRIGLRVGVIRIEWSDPPESFAVTGRDGRVFTGKIVEIGTRSGSMRTEHVRVALMGVVVRAPDGALARVVGVELFASMMQVAGADVGLLLVPAEEQ